MAKNKIQTDGVQAIENEQIDQHGDEQQHQQQPEYKGNAPAKVFRAKGVKVSLFRNFTKDGSRDFWKATVQKIYKDGNEFKTTNSLGRDDIPVVRHLLQKAYEFMLEIES